jgi:hypothetical protein
MLQSERLKVKNNYVHDVIAKVEIKIIGERIRLRSVRWEYSQLPESK